VIRPLRSIKNIKWVGGLLIAICVSILILSIWQYVGERHNLVRLLLSTPTGIATYVLRHHSVLASALVTTAFESTVGLLIAGALSLTMMICALLFPSVLRYALPIIVASQVVPLVTLAPLFILLFGIGVISKVAMTTLMCFFPIFISFARAVVTLPDALTQLLFVYDAGRAFSIRRVIVPLASPGIFAGARVSATLAVIGAIVAEFNGAERGLGKNLFLAAKRLEPELMVSSLIGSTLLAGALYGATVLLERATGTWYLASATQEGADAALS
jgi:NitT/TauT family transport system permease protein